jgi:hypothetical protein
VAKCNEENKRLQEELFRSRRSEAQKDHELTYIRRQLEESADKIIELNVSARKNGGVTASTPVHQSNSNTHRSLKSTPVR